MSLLSQSYYGNTLQEWLTAAGVTLLVFAALCLLRLLLKRHIAKLVSRTSSEIDDLVVHVTEKTRLTFFVIVSLSIGAYFVELHPKASRVLDIVVVLSWLLQSATWGNGVITFWLSRTMRKRLVADASSATTLAALGFLGRLVLWIVILLLALDNLGVNITALVAGLGVGGVAVALALQSILGDVFASLSIVIDKPFIIGDFIIIDDYQGSVESIGLKTTRVRSLSGEVIVFSNSDLLRSRIRNYKHLFERRVVFSIKVSHRTPVEAIIPIPSLLREIVERQQSVRFDRAHFAELADFAFRFEVVYFVLSPEYSAYMDIQQALNLDILRALEERGIVLAQPSPSIHLHGSPTASATSTESR